MRRYIIGNWKMQLTEPESETLAKEVARLWSAQGAAAENTVVVVCPSHDAIDAVGSLLKGTTVAMGGQDVFWEDKGAYTGEISPKTLKELGCEYCIVGHSERRQHLGETDQMVNKKVVALLKHDINPIVCVGETKEERQAGKRDSVVISQVRAALEGTRPVGRQHVIIAYEPRWVIGTGQAVAPDDAASMHYLIQETLQELYPSGVVEAQFAVIYGGSVDPSNIRGLLSIDAIHGVLVGGVSLKAKEFIALAEAAADMGK